jgi:crotonyl-CoA reductase
VQKILDAILSGTATGPTTLALDIPDPTARSTVHKDEVGDVRGLSPPRRTPAASLHVEDVALPELGPGEALVAVMASAVNYNTVWTSIFEPVSTFGFLERYGRTNPLPSVTTCPTTSSAPTSPASCCAPAPASQVEARRRGRRALPVRRARVPDGHDDTMLDPEQRIWGFETNFGGLAELALVKANQLMPKPAHLTWEEAASPGLVNSTAYRQLVSQATARG